MLRGVTPTMLTKPEHAGFVRALLFHCRLAFLCLARMLGRQEDVSWSGSEMVDSRDVIRLAQYLQGFMIAPSTASWFSHPSFDYNSILRFQSGGGELGDFQRQHLAVRFET